MNTPTPDAPSAPIASPTPTPATVELYVAIPSGSWRSFEVGKLHLDQWKSEHPVYGIVEVPVDMEWATKELVAKAVASGMNPEQVVDGVKLIRAWTLYVWPNGDWRTEEDDDLHQKMQESDDYRSITLRDYHDVEDVAVVAEMAANGASLSSIEEYLDSLAQLPR